MNFILYDEEEFKEYLETLPIKVRARVLALIDVIEEIGLVEAMKKGWVSKLGNNLYEIRLEMNGLFPRAIFFKVAVKHSNAGPEYVITNVFSKKANKTPKTEISKAIGRRRRYTKLYWYSKISIYLTI